MRALVATGGPDLLRLDEIDEPAPDRSEVVISVEASSVNHGEAEWVAAAASGFGPGWDIAGRVERAAADGSGPPEGTRVAAFLGAGAWAERVAVPSQRVGVLPDGLDASSAAGLPVVGLTALRALRAAGPALAQRVLVTGAKGAIGRVAVQLAQRAGADVVALSREGPELDGRFDVVLDAVGGPVLAAALAHLAPGGIAVVYGDASHEPTTFNSGDLFLTAPEARVHALRMDASPHPERFGADLEHLARLVIAGELDLELDVPTSWSNAGDVIGASLAQRPARKPVLRFD